MSQCVDLGRAGGLWDILFLIMHVMIHVGIAWWSLTTIEISLDFCIIEEPKASDWRTVKAVLNHCVNSLYCKRLAPTKELGVNENMNIHFKY